MRPGPARIHLSDDTVDALQSVTEGGYSVKDLLDPSLHVAVTANGNRHFYCVLRLGSFPEMSVDRARALAERLGEVVAEQRLIKRPVRRDGEAEMAAE
jgi:hypothetical protein